MSVATQTMKKFVNAPEDVVKESLAGLAAAHADLLRVDFENQIVVRKDAPVAGKVGLVSGGGSGSRAAARRFRRPRHAGRRVPRRGVHLAGAGSDARRDEGGRRRRRRAAHRQELHRRRDELQARRGARRGRGHQGRVRPDERRCRRRGQPVHGRPSRRRRHRAAREDRRREGRGGRFARRGRGGRDEGERARPQLRRRADLLCDARLRARRPSRSAPTRWSSASAFTASRDGGARRSSPASEIVAEMAEAILSDLSPPRAPGCSRSSTARRHAADRALPASTTSSQSSSPTAG